MITINKKQYKKDYVVEKHSCKGCVGKEKDFNLCRKLPNGCSGGDKYIGEYIWRLHEIK